MHESPPVTEAAASSLFASNILAQSILYWVVTAGIGHEKRGYLKVNFAEKRIYKK